ncbi:virion structural protein [Cyanophage S-RIM44]|uniref:Virion structural protein n=2 Tax=Vellamovirus TaxID=2733139 RepID=A0A140IEQ1_9CAUD|nr:virion structural protein [Prochlorococcus phage Syn1]AMO43343.1 virion structural protein [Cyanophage S-RIM44]ADO99201.1 virion structural protein [Prochlorococcus phage Syn1]AOO11815.1 virion structural protein [Cyanophage S-RIM44]AOO12516.1 virion structural protein [Cyanophage S-RIM44]AOO12982.1 virion structural protein [Cyanophage S-RIM44]
MPNNLKTFDSAGGFSVENTEMINELKDVKNVNSLEIKNSFYASDSSASHYILRGLNTSILSIDDVNTLIELPNTTINFVEAHIIGVNDSGAGHISLRLDAVVSVDSAGSKTAFSTMETIIEDSIPVNQTWNIEPFTGGAANRFSFQTTRIGTTENIKWIAYVKVVSIAWQ